MNNLSVENSLSSTFNYENKDQVNQSLSKSLVTSVVLPVFNPTEVEQREFLTTQSLIPQVASETKQVGIKKRRMYVPWEEEEIECLKQERMNRKNFKDIAKLLKNQRSVQAIAAKWSRLHLNNYQSLTRPYHKWTEDEISQLKSISTEQARVKQTWIALAGQMSHRHHPTSIKMKWTQLNKSHLIQSTTLSIASASANAIFQNKSLLAGNQPETLVEKEIITSQRQQVPTDGKSRTFISSMEEKKKRDRQNLIDGIDELIAMAKKHKVYSQQ